MKKIICDGCGSDKAKTYGYFTTRQMDPSGNGYNNVHEYIDLCFDCTQEWVLKNKKKLTELTTSNSSTKTIIHG